MKDIDYGHVEIKLKEIMESQDISINKLACRAEMQRTQLKKYINNNVQRVDLAILSRLCYCLDCDLNDILVYVKDE
ncbi:MAG: helix-turn-helix domain-containing protein [Anaerovoracaceae bacterium]